MSLSRTRLLFAPEQGPMHLQRTPLSCFGSRKKPAMDFFYG
jgi:hypothetical protein